MRLTKALVKSFLPTRPKHAHKGTFGRVLIVAGSANMAGAGVLCARGALQTGAGLRGSSRRAGKLNFGLAGKIRRDFRAGCG